MTLSEQLAALGERATQADRDAAADALWDMGVDWGACGDVREGRVSHPLQQAFARHRIAALRAEPPADVAELVAYHRGQHLRHPDADVIPFKKTADALSTLARRNAELEAAVMAVVEATRAYLPPDGIDAKECISRVLAATDNPAINPVTADIEARAALKGASDA